MLDITIQYADLTYFLLIFVRVTCFLFVAPFFSLGQTPRTVRAALGLFLSMILFQALPHNEVVYDSVIGYAILVMKEAVTGLLIGFGSMLCSHIVAFAGHIVDMETGLSMASVMDPTTNQQTSITGIYYNYILMLMLVVSGMHRYLIQALADTFTLISIGGAVFHMDALLNSFLKFMSDYLVIGFRICLPVFGVTLLLNAILGILAKVSPQMNMFAVGIQLKLLVGLSVLFLTVSMLPSAAGFIYDEIRKVTVLFVEAMM